MNKADKEYLASVAALGCIICRRPATIHHIRNGRGMGQRAGHRETLPLCAVHHQHGGHGVAIHAGQKTWEAKYGTERELLAQVRRELGYPEAAE